MDMYQIVEIIREKAHQYYFNPDNLIDDVMKETGLSRAEVYNIINELVK